MEYYRYKDDERFEDFEHVDDEIKELAHVLMQEFLTNDVRGYIEAAEFLFSQYPSACEKYLYDSNNYGILFYCMGYDANGQQELHERIYDMTGVEVL